MPSETLKDVLLWQERTYGEKIAIVDSPDGKRWSFHELNDFSRRICAGYARQGDVRKNDRIG